jgi:hypothetical protein
LATIIGCDEPRYGMGIGRPPIQDVERTTHLPVTITEVAFAPVGVEIATAEQIDLSTLKLCNANATCQDLTGTLAAGRRLWWDAAASGLPNLGIVYSAGELVLIDAEGTVHAELAWGSDPTVLGSPYVFAALQSGVATTVGHVALPYPLPSGVNVAVEGAARGCALPSMPQADGTQGVATIDATLCPMTTPELDSILKISGTDLAQNTVSISNAVGNDLPLYGVRLCQEPRCVVFSAQQAIPAAAAVTLHLGVAGTDSATDFYFEEATAPKAGLIRLVAPGVVDIEKATALSTKS